MKKVLALVLSLAMSMSMVTFAAAAAVDTVEVDAVITNDFNSPTGDDGRLFPGLTYYLKVENGNGNILGKDSTVSASWTKGGAMVDSVKIVKKETQYFAAIKLNKNYTLVEMKDLIGKLNFKKVKLDNDGLYNDTASYSLKYTGDIADFRVANNLDTSWSGYSKIDDAEDDILYAAEHTVYEIDGSGWVSFGSDNRLAQITAKFSDGEKIYAYFNEDSIDAVLDKYDDGEAVIDFIRFPAKPQLRKTSTVTFDRGFSSKGYIYEWDGKTLKEIKGAKWDSEDGTWTIETNKLTDYVFSDEKLIASSSSESSESKDTGSTTEPNPGTGANDFVGLAVALAVVSVAGIAVAKRK